MRNSVIWMWGASAVLAWGVAVCPLIGQEEGLTLPDWEQDEVQIFPLGGSLLPQAPADMREQAAPGVGPGQASPSGGQEERDGKRSGEAEHLVEVGADFFERSEGLRSGGFVFDPGGCLGEEEREELSRVLSNHAEKAKIEVHVVVLNGKQQLPKQVDLSKVSGANLVGGVGCMVVYPLGEPWRVRLFMSRRVTEVVKPDYLRNLARACIQDAVKVTDAEEQLLRFTNQLSIRLTWLEREHDLPELLNAEGVAMPVVASIPTSTAVTEVGMQAPVEKEPPAWRGWWERLEPWVWRSVVGLVALILLWVLGRWWWRRAWRRKKVVVWILPEVQIRPRLGGKHCGGGGASVKY